MQFHSAQLENGLEIVAECDDELHSAALGFFVKTGSRDETPAECGVTHFLEHMVFKGTPNRTALEVNYDFDKIGASYNAFTSEENTVFYAAILPEYLPQAVDILADILRPSLRGEDFDERLRRPGQHGDAFGLVVPARELPVCRGEASADLRDRPVVRDVMPIDTLERGRSRRDSYGQGSAEANSRASSSSRCPGSKDSRRNSLPLRAR